jgi:hypothetical protein
MSSYYFHKITVLDRSVDVSAVSLLLFLQVIPFGLELDEGLGEKKVMAEALMTTEIVEKDWMVMVVAVVVVVSSPGDNENHMAMGGILEPCREQWSLDFEFFEKMMFQALNIVGEEAALA